MKSINENIAYAKSVLNKNGINQDSPEYQDYLKIREICGGNNGYVGILTKIRFVDKIEDMEEIQSIFDVLKNSKIDVNKLNKLSYDQILDMFYTELAEDKDKDEDLELYYKDSQYSYYKVFTHKGILKIASPSWCLKTKSHWDNYHSKYPEQWVVIDNRYVKNIITPDNNYLDHYRSSKGWVRFGISLNTEDLSYVAFSDNNDKVRHSDNHTFLGVLFTILNLIKGIKKSFYERFPGCESIGTSKSWVKVVDKERVCNNLNLPDGHLDDESEIYLFFSKTYSSNVGMLLLGDSLPKAMYATRKNYDLTFVNLTGFSQNILDEYALKSDDILYVGIKLKKGKITEEEIVKSKQFIGKVDKWLVFDRNDNWYLVVNTQIPTYQLPVYTINDRKYDMDNPLYFYVSKEDYRIYNTDKSVSDKYSNGVINLLKKINKKNQPKPEEKKPEEKKVRGFWDFFKKK